MVGGFVKALLVAAFLLAAVACDETSGAATADNPTADSAGSTPSAETSPSPSPSTPAAAPTKVVFVNAPLTVAHGQNATLKVKTAPNTSCSIEVDYKSGPSSATGLVTKNSDGAGNVSWTWKVGTNTTRGAWPITVTCGDKSAETHITVT
jgi:micrococcal nuclease